jgi:uncharacterized cupredoxin-like copper-binding protein
MRPNVVRLVAAVVLATTMAGCSRHSSAASGERVGASLKDFGIQLDRPSVPAGPVVFELHNTGPSTHEFNVDRLTKLPADSAGTEPATPGTDPPDVVPPGLSAAGVELRSDGLSVDEDSPAFDRAGSAEEIPLGSRTRLSVKLTRGTYLLYCNLEGHFLGGMEAVFHVN